MRLWKMRNAREEFGGGKLDLQIWSYTQFPGYHAGPRHEEQTSVAQLLGADARRHCSPCGRDKDPVRRRAFVYFRNKNLVQFTDDRHCLRVRAC
jgi:hypothetical protein